MQQPATKRTSDPQNKKSTEPRRLPQQGEAGDSAIDRKLVESRSNSFFLDSFCKRKFRAVDMRK